MPARRLSNCRLCPAGLTSLPKPIGSAWPIWSRRSRARRQPPWPQAVAYPWVSPASCGRVPRRVRRAARKSPAPLYHAATRAVQKTFWEAYATFVAAFREASERLRAGDRMRVSDRLLSTRTALCRRGGRQSGSGQRGEKNRAEAQDRERGRNRHGVSPGCLIARNGIARK